MSPLFAFSLTIPLNHQRVLFRCISPPSSSLALSLSLSAISHSSSFIPSGSNNCVFFFIGYSPFAVHIIMANNLEACPLWDYLQWPWWGMDKPGASEVEVGPGCQLRFCWHAHVSLCCSHLWRHPLLMWGKTSPLNPEKNVCHWCLWSSFVDSNNQSQQK